MKKVARLRVPQDEFVPPGVKANANTEQSVRTTGRIKKPKAVFDPSDNYVPRSHRLSIPLATLPTPSTTPVKAANVSLSPPTSSAHRERSLSTGSNTSLNSSPVVGGDVCIVCHKKEPRRGGNYRNKLVSCVDCGKRVHKLCMSSDFHDASPLRQKFKCDNCRTCEVCSGSARIASNSCVKCCKTYHFGCHIPKLSKAYQTDRNWKCYKCDPNSTAAKNSSATISNNNRNINDDTVMPVKIIRQIIGDNANLIGSSQKQTQQQTQANSKEQQVKKLQEPAKLQDQNHKIVQPKRNEQTQERVKISETPAEASVKTPTLRRNRAVFQNSSYTSTSSSDDSNDEDYEYVEKKKRRTNNEHNNNHDVVNAPDIKPLINHASKNAIKGIPNREVVKSWSVEQVSEYIGEHFPNEAYVFKEQEIDGNALLLLKRSDVVQKLPLKLGPSLRLYNLILKVQTQTANDPTLGWDCSVETLLSSIE